MNIKTKFNRGQMVFVIDNNGIEQYPIESIEYRNGQIIYTLLIRKAQLLGDKDILIDREEQNCFKTIDALARNYKEKFKKD